MPLAPEEQSIIMESARRFFLERKEACINAYREYQRTGSQEHTNYTKVWKDMLEMGLGTILLHEDSLQDSHGSHQDYVLMGEFLKLAGKHLVPSPLLWTGMIAVESFQNKELIKKHLEKGTIILPAFDEHLYHDPFNINASAQKTKNGYVLNGTKSFIMDGQHADAYLVSVKIDGHKKNSDFAIFFIPKSLCEITQLDTLDARGAVHIVFKDLALPLEAFVGDASCYRRALVGGYVGLSCEMLGIAQELFDRTIAYLKERKQFGRPIGSFQALQHRASMMFEALSMAQCVVAETLENYQSENGKHTERLSHICKKHCNDLLCLLGKESIQMHGGIGMTAECDIGLYFKRGQVQEHLLGTSLFHKKSYLTSKKQQDRE